MAQLSKLYASALFDLALEGGSQDVYLEQAAYLCDILGDEDAARIISHPHISAAEKTAFLENVAEGKIGGDLLGLVRLMVEKRREGAIMPALNEFIDMVNDRYRKTTATVVSARELDEAQIAEIGALLSKKLDKQVEIDAQIEPSVIGGLSIHVDGWFIDRTIKTQINEMKQNVKAAH